MRLIMINRFDSTIKNTNTINKNNYDNTENITINNNMVIDINIIKRLQNNNLWCYWNINILLLIILHSY